MLFLLEIINKHLLDQLQLFLWLIFQGASHDECRLFADQAQRQQAGGERAVLGQLAAATALYPEPGERYNLVPRAWLATWRVYMAAAAKRAVGAGAAPQALQDSVVVAAPLPAMCSCFKHFGHLMPLGDTSMSVLSAILDEIWLCKHTYSNGAAQSN